MKTPYDIACFGTSLTNGNATGDGQWSGYLARALLPGLDRDVRVYQFGYPGGTSQNAIDSAWHVPAGLIKPRLVVMEWGMNDASTGSGLSVAQANANALTLINAIKAASPGSKFALMTMNPTTSSARSALPTFYQGYRDLVAADPDLILIDVTGSWGGFSTTDIPDGIHPTGAAMRTKAIPVMASAIKPVIQAAA